MYSFEYNRKVIVTRNCKLEGDRSIRKHKARWKDEYSYKCRHYGPGGIPETGEEKEDIPSSNR
jgi:hypothetical protein